ncbi:MAG: ubiquinol-cytochrome c reductase iron-sulfur subunit [Pseudomonadota bacterium]|nr:ubiquinol-cytochrome c reductase iron-sulfur subunit [Pseudomonadota bacterium]
MSELKKQSLNPTSNRRTFLGRLWIGLGLVALVQFLGGAVAFLVSGSGKKAAHEPLFIDVGTVDNFAPGSVTLIRQGELYLNRLEDGAFLALSRKCTHLGCAVAWDEKDKLFACPCHASTFDENGKVLKTPAPRPLDQHPLVIEKGRVTIDIETRRKRQFFKPEQLTYATKPGLLNRDN